MSTDLDPLFKRLHLANARRVWRDLVRRAELEEWSYEQLLTTLISEEVAHRRGTRLHRAVRSAQFPFLRTIEEFDFSYQSTLRLTTFGSLLSPDFITEGHSVILEGKPGRGKTHLAIAIAYRAMQNGFEALFVNCAELIDDLSCASRRGELRDALMRYLRPHVLVVDEVGYLAYGDDAANVLFHVVNERHIKKRAMVFTTNKKPKRWGPVLHDDDLAEAIVDRILDRGRLLRLDGPSLRTKHLAGDTSLDDDQDEPGDRRVSGTNTAEFPEPTTAALRARPHHRRRACTPALERRERSREIRRSSRAARPGSPSHRTRNRSPPARSEGGRDLLEVEPEVLSMRAESVEGPGEVGLHGDAERATRRDDAEEDARAMRALGAAGEEHVEPELREGLELALRGRVVDRDRGVVDESCQAAQWSR
jgi:DNA replication protein DnaC